MPSARPLPPPPARGRRNTADAIQEALEVSGSLDPRDVIARVMERGVQAVEADRATLSSLIDDEVVIEATYGRSGAITWIGQRYPRSLLTEQPLVRAALDSLEPVLGGQLVVERARPEFQSALDQVRHTAVMPLVHAGAAVGLLVLSRYEDRPFSTADLGSLRLLSTISGLALRNARLFEEAQTARRLAAAAAERLAAAVEAAEDVASQVELDQVLGRLMRRAVTAVGADAASLSQVEGQEMIVESSTGSVPVGSRWPIAPRVLEGIRHGRPVQLAAAEYAGTPAGLEPIVQPFKRFLIAPLLVGGETIGLIAIGRHKDEPFDAASISVLQQFTTLGALLLRNARLRARSLEAERAKSDFMDVAVHALRSPLSVTSGYLSMALEGNFGEVPDRLRAPLQTALRKNQEGRAVAEELLTVARMEGERLRPQPEVISADWVLHEAVARATPRAALLQGTLRIAPGPPVKLLADRGFTDRIFDNLINNALAYAAGPPVITLAASRDGDAVEIAVSDNGRGIPEPDQVRVFQRFERGSDPAVRDVAGSGLGLYVSRGLATRMGGALTLASSAPGQGSTFVLRLPAA
ncbi:MAG TPA: ATP-binding protein [Candidatus Limnocylindrales bacterium]|nr:ATP-binding protein [Candidatus Limnocylindrales bacterium]